MFKFGTKVPSLGGYGAYPINAEGKLLCYYEAWAFKSCGAAALVGFNQSYPTWDGWNDTAKVEALVEFLRNNIPLGTHNAQEFYFLLSSSQMESGNFSALVSSEYVKQVDSYKKKPYGGTPLYLYRLSVQKDFAFDKKKTKAAV